MGEARPDSTFGGITLAQFRAAWKIAQDARARIADLEAQLKQAISERGDADDDCLAKAQLVVNGIIGDPEHGPDSVLYEASGYTRKSERYSGLTRKGNKPSTK